MGKRKRRAGLVSGVWVLLVFVAVFGVVLNVPVVWGSGTIYIRADGSIDPPTAPISTVDNVTYTFTDNINSDTDGIVVERSNIVVDGNGYTLQGPGSGSETGIYLPGTNNVTIKNTNIKNYYYGIVLSSSSGNSISGNNITNNWDGIWLEYSSNNSISGNNITENNWDGIRLSYSSNNSISGNNITENNVGGIWLYGSSNSSISGNNITNNWGGIGLSYSSNNSISGNNITNNVGGIGLSSSSGNSISGNNITNNVGGIWLYGSSNNSISGNNITENNWDGIVLYGSSDYNSISGNNITENNYYGIWLEYSSNNSISGNNITANNGGGIWLYGSSNNSISGNNIANNEYGIELYFSSGNKFYHNNFVNNTIKQANATVGYMNVWDDGYPSGGNYWSDYTGVDLFSGPYQNIPGSDGVGDTPYVIDADNRDRYPLMGPMSFFNAATYDAVTLYVGVISKFEVSNFSFNEHMKHITFNIGVPMPPINVTFLPSNNFTLPADFCRVTIPKQLLWCDTPEEWIVMIDGTHADYRVFEDDSHTYIYFVYYHVNVTYTVGIIGTHAMTPPIERKPGVKAGSWAYYHVNVTYYTNDPNPPISPPERMMDWHRMFIEHVQETNITFLTVSHYVGCYYENRTGMIDVDTGDGINVVLPIIAANLSAGNPVYSKPPYTEYKINETISRLYLGSLREINYLHITTQGYSESYEIHFSFSVHIYWDRITGILTEYIWESMWKKDVYETVLRASYNITDTNLWGQLLPPIEMVFNVSWGEETYPVAVTSNSTITHFNFSQPLKQISFNVTGLDGSTGFCNVTIPTVLLGGPYMIVIDGEVLLEWVDPPTNGTHTFLYFTYNHSTQTVKIIGTTVIPEFPAATIMPLFMILTMLAVVFAKRKLPRKQKI